MRISADRHDPGYEAYCRNRDVIVLLNGDPQRLVVTADEGAGVIVRYRIDDRGRPFRDGERMAMEVVCGRVEVRARGQ
jgi:hypothetical protein